MPSVRFILGRAGTGKTRRCFQSIVEALRADPMGPPILWIVPKQVTFSAERELTCLSGLGGFCRARVLSFDQLGDEILLECGGNAVPLVDELGRQMVIGHLLRTNQSKLEFFGGVAHQTGLAAELDETFAELERCGKSADDLAALLGELDSARSHDVESQALRAKMHDLHLLYAAYSAYLGQERLDPHRRLQQVLDLLDHCSLVRGAQVYVDAFSEYTDFERRILAGLAKVARSVEVTLMVDPRSPIVRDPKQAPHELSAFHPTEWAYRKLHQTFEAEGVRIETPVQLIDITRFADATLAQIEHKLFDEIAPRGTGFQPVQATSPHGLQTRATNSSPLELIEAPDRRGEVDVAASRIRELLRSGMRLRDIVLLVRDIDDYHALIDASFAEHDIPYFVDRRRAAAHHPLLQFVRAAFLVARSGWPHDAMMTILKSGLAGLDLAQADEVENYVLAHRIRGSMWANEQSWTFRRTIRRSSDDDDRESQQRVEIERIDRLRRDVVDRLRHFVERLRAQRELPVRLVVVELFNLFERCKVQATLAGWMKESADAGEFEQRGEHEQVWNKLVELFEQMVDVLGDERVTLGGFQDILEAGLERFDLALTPPTVDQVLVGAVDRTRPSSRVRAAIVLGLNDGQFPRVAQFDSILSDRERVSLSRRNLDLDPNTERRLLDERFFGYVAFTRASERLIVTRATADEAGRPSHPSSFWQRLRAIVPDAPVTQVPRAATISPQLISTPRQLVTSLMKWSRDDSVESKSWPALYQWLAKHECKSDALDTVRYRSWKALSYANRAKLSDDLAGKLFTSPLHAGVSQIESFATCPYKHFLRYGLRLEVREDEDVTAMDLGNVFHQVLEKLIREMLATRKDLTDLDTKVTDEMIRAYAQDIGKSLRGEIMLSTARNKYLLARIEKTLTQVVAAQRAAARRGSFRPAHAELSFGLGEKLPPLRIATPNGRELMLRGKIDRVDIADRGAVAVIDYKLSGNSLALDRVYHGISLQLLTYLLVLESCGETLAGHKLTPAAGFYLQLLRKLEEVKHPEEACDPDDPLFDLKVKPRGIFNGDFIGSLDSDLIQTQGASEVVSAYIKKDGEFGHTGNTDVAQSRQFSALLRHVRKRLGELADQILAGRIDVAPYRINRATPCPRCEYRSVCRFDPAINRYHTLEPMKRDDVLKVIVEGD